MVHHFPVLLLFFSSDFRSNIHYKMELKKYNYFLITMKDQIYIPSSIFFPPISASNGAEELNITTFLLLINDRSNAIF